MKRATILISKITILRSNKHRLDPKMLNNMCEEIQLREMMLLSTKINKTNQIIKMKFKTC